MKASERHKLKDDLFAQTVAGGVGWARTHGALLGAAAALVLLAAVASLVIVSSRRTREATATDLLDKADYQANFLRANRQAVTRENLARVLGAYKVIMDEYPATRAGAVAPYNAGQFFLAIGRPTEARELFLRALERGKEYPSLTSLSQFAIATCYEAEGDLPNTATWYQRFAEAHREGPLAPAALVALGRVCVSQATLLEMAARKPNAQDAEGMRNAARQARADADRLFRGAAESGAGTLWATMAEFRMAQPDLPPPPPPLAPTPPPTAAPDTDATTTMIAPPATPATTIPPVAPEPAGPRL